MTCPTCAAHLAEIQRLDGEPAKARADNGVMAKALRAMGEMGVESDEAADAARAEVEHLKGCVEATTTIAAETDAEVSRLKAGLVEMRASLLAFAETDHDAMDENECLDHADKTLASIGVAIDALIVTEST